MQADPPTFQAEASLQGRQFAEQCDIVLRDLGYQLAGSLNIQEVGVEIDRVATSPKSTRVWFEYKGSVRGDRPGLRRTDTLKKAIANGALIRGLKEPSPYVVLTSHLPEGGSGRAMLEASIRLGYINAVVCLYDPASVSALRGF